MPLLSEVVEALVTVHDRIEDSPVVIDDGFADKELMTGRPELPEQVVPPGVIVYTVDPVACATVVLTTPCVHEVETVPPPLDVATVRS